MKKGTIKLSEFGQPMTRKFGQVQPALIQAEAIQEAIQSAAEGFLPDKYVERRLITPPGFTTSGRKIGRGRKRKGSR